MSFEQFTDSKNNSGKVLIPSLEELDFRVHKFYLYTFSYSMTLTDNFVFYCLISHILEIFFVNVIAISLEIL